MSLTVHVHATSTTEIIMTARHHVPTDQFTEETLSENDAPDAGRATRPPSREVRILDFKDGRTGVAVTHGPVDPSRILITLRSGQAVLQISVEEGVGRQIADGLASVLPSFRAVRSRLR
jgi:hypothetical protein